MKFALIDRILEYQAGQRITAIKAISRSEEYLGDHFPTFPVLPGVFMLQVLVESATWLVRVTNDFAAGVVLLKEAKNVTYKSFVKPGQVLRAEVVCHRMATEGSDFVGSGRCDDTEVVKARFSLSHFKLADRSPVLQSVDCTLRDAARRQWGLLYPTAEAQSASAPAPAVS